MLEQCTIVKLDVGFLVNVEPGKPLAAFSSLVELTAWLPGYFVSEYIIPYSADPDFAELETCRPSEELHSPETPSVSVDAPLASEPFEATTYSSTRIGALTADEPKLAGKVFKEIAEEIKVDRQDAVALAGDAAPVEVPVQEDARPTINSDISEGAQSVLTALDAISLKAGSQQVCISYKNLAKLAEVKVGSVRFFCQSLLKKGFLTKIHNPGNDADHVFTLAEEWE